MSNIASQRISDKKFKSHFRFLSFNFIFNRKKLYVFIILYLGLVSLEYARYFNVYRDFILGAF